ncbi:MAG: AraC family ligand binding domain-containing protein [Kiritimatiellae bacterium]|nr:AraC family ligand binding domain-containing protein [Kiritimatiellia bacterium]
MAQRRSYVQTSQNAFTPQALNIIVDGRLYNFTLIHITIDVTHRIDKRQRTNEHLHDVFHMVVYTEGVNAFTFRGKARPVLPGTVALTSPGEPHNFLVLKKGAAVYSEMTFAYRGLDNEPLRIGFDRLLSVFAGIDLPVIRFPVVLPGQKTREMKTLLEHTLDRLESTSHLSNMMAAQTIIALFALIIRECFLPKEQDQYPAFTPIQRVQSYLEA